MLGIIASVLAYKAAPNLVYIMADDLGYGEIGCFGQQKIPTPNLDRLAADGVRMTRAYSASPVCAPTRYSLLTGKHQGHAAIRGNIEQGGFGPNDKEGQMPIAASETLLPEVLKRGGYRTGLVGKWGLGGPEPGQSPLDHGFDFFYGYLCQRRAHNSYPAYLWKNRNVDLLDNPVYSAHQKIPQPLGSEDEYYQRYSGKTHSATRMMEESVQFIRTSTPGQPFFLYFAPTLPHVALQAPRSWVERFPEEWDVKPYLGQNSYLPNPRPRATYAAMIAYLDEVVGQVLKAIDEAGARDNTLVIFTSDNGAVDNVGGSDRKFFNSNGGLRAGKMSLYEGGVRVPMIARWPGRIPAGRSDSTVVTSYDAMATLCQAAGLAAPKTDGRSYLSALTAKPQPPRPWVYFEYPEASVMQAAIFGNYKVIRPNMKVDAKLVELYDLETDPAESKDLAKARPDLVAKGLEILRRQHRPNPLFPLGLLDKPN